MITQPMGVQELILKHSSTHPLFAGAPGCDTYSATWSVEREGIMIHQVAPSEADAAAPVFIRAAASYLLPLTGVLAWSAVESVFDKYCINKNWGCNLDGTPRSNEPAHNDADDDLGIFELKAGLLIGRAPGVTNLAQAQTFAYDIKNAIPYACSLYAEHVAWAETQIATGFPAYVDPRFRNRYVLATCAYNFGRVGVLRDWVVKGKFPPHGVSVIRYEQKFAEWMQLPTIHAGLSLDEGPATPVK